MPDAPRRAAVWLDPSQLGFVRAVADAAGFVFAAAGSPAKGQSGQVAGALACAAVDDLRSLLTEADVDLVWIASPGDFGVEGGAHDARAVAAASARNVKIASLDPVPMSALDIAPGEWLPDAPVQPAKLLRFPGLLRFSRPFREASETLASFGTPRTALVDAWSGSAHGSLAARLLSVIDTVLTFMGEPESIDASYVGPHHVAGLHALPGETLRDLHGDLVATLRFPDGRSAAIATSNAAGRWNSGATFLSEHGRLRFYDDGFEWVNADGSKHDDMRLGKGKRGQEKQPDHGVATIADSLARLLDPAMPDTGPINIEGILVVAQAALLSARTGQPESPATIRRMTNG